MAQKNLLRKKEKGATAAARQSKHAKTSIQRKGSKYIKSRHRISSIAGISK